MRSTLTLARSLNPVASLWWKFCGCHVYEILDASVTVDRICSPYSVPSTHPYVPRSPSFPPPSWQGEKSPETIFLLVQRSTDIGGLHIERKTLLEIVTNTCTKQRNHNTRR